MVKQSLRFGSNKIEKKFHFLKNLTVIDDVDIDKIISDVSAYHKNKKTDAKFFIEFEDDKKLGHCASSSRSPKIKWLCQ